MLNRGVARVSNANANPNHRQCFSAIFSVDLVLIVVFLIGLYAFHVGDHAGYFGFFSCGQVVLGDVGGRVGLVGGGLHLGMAPA